MSWTQAGVCDAACHANFSLGFATGVGVLMGLIGFVGLGYYLIQYFRYVREPGAKQ